MASGDSIDAAAKKVEAAIKEMVEVGVKSGTRAVVKMLRDWADKVEKNYEPEKPQKK